MISICKKCKSICIGEIIPHSEEVLYECQGCGDKFQAPDDKIKGVEDE